MEDNLHESYKRTLRSVILFREFCDNPTKDNASKAIKNYFDARMKGSLFNIKDSEIKKLLEKSEHMVSAFALGLIFMDLVSDKIENIVKENSPKAFLNATSAGSRYEYFWFLCCLSHDIASAYEINTDEENRKDYVKLNDFLNDKGISYTVYNEADLEMYKLRPFIHTYKKEVVERYFEIRMEDCRIDHGIAGGYCFFDMLVKNYINTSREEEKENKDSFCTHHEGHCLYWNKNQIWIMAYVADAIISHNIWHKRYNEDMLKCITSGNEEEILLNVNEHPLLFILGLVDTIEPLKRFSGVLPEDVFKNIYITFDKENKKINISWTRELENYQGFDKWKDNISSLEEWMRVKISVCENNEENHGIEVQVI